MKANYELTRIGIKLKASFLLLFLFLAVVFQLKAADPVLVSSPACSHYCETGTGVKLGIVGGNAITYVLWKDNVVTAYSIDGPAADTVWFNSDASTFTYGNYSLNGPFPTYNIGNVLVVVRDAYTSDPTDGGATTSTISCGESTTLYTLGGSGTTFKWYAGGCGAGTAVFSSATTSTYTVSNLTQTTTFYGRWENVSCYSNCYTVTITVNPPVAPAITSAIPNPICSGNPVTISTDYGGILEWYTGGCGTGGVATQTGSYTSGNLETNTTFWVRKAAITGGCEASECASVTITVNPTPTAPTGTASYDYCVGATETLTVSSGTPANVHWYNSDCGVGEVASQTVEYGITVASGTNYYYVRNETTTCNSSCFTITVIGHTPTATPTVSLTPTEICVDKPVTLNATGGAGEIFEWYDTNCGEGFVVSGTTSAVVTPTSDGQISYWGRWTSLGCPNSGCASATVTVYTVTDPTGGEPGTSTICYNTSTTLTATGGSGKTFKWYKDGCGQGTAIGTGTNTVSTGILTTTTSFYGRWEGPDCNSGCVTVVVTVTQIPAAPILSSNAVNNTICIGSYATLSAVVDGNGTEFNWYEDNCGGGPSLGTNPASLVASPTITRVYYAKYNNACFSVCSSITICVDSPPAAPTSPSQSASVICAGTPVNISAQGGPGTYKQCPEPGCPDIPITATFYWYKNNCGPTTPDNLVATVTTASQTVTVTPTETTIYYGQWRNSCGGSGCVSLTVSVYTVTTVATITASPATICSGNETTLFTESPATYNDVAPYSTLYWYRDGCGTENNGIFVASNTSSFNVSPTVTNSPSTIIYYARYENPLCKGSCTTVAVTVNPRPTTPISADATKLRLCEVGQTTAISTLPATGVGTFTWYDGDICGTIETPPSQVATGTTWTFDPTTSGTYTFYGRWEAGECGNSSCVSVTILVDPENTPITITADPNPVCAGSAVKLTASQDPIDPGYMLAWYSGGTDCGGTQQATNVTTLTQTPTLQTTKYSARYEGGTCPAGPCAVVTVEQSPVPTTPVITVDPPTMPICAGTKVTLEVTPGPAGTWIEWYDYVGTGYSECGNHQVVTGTTSIVVSPTTTTSYYARMMSLNCAPSSCASVTLTVLPKPTGQKNVSVTPTPTVCEGQLITLNGEPNVGETTLHWYTTPNCVPASEIGVGNTVTLVATITPLTKHFYVRAEADPCTPSAVSEVTVVVIPLPINPGSITATPAQTVCYGTAVTMQAVNHESGAGHENDYAQWYTGSNSCGTTVLATVPITSNGGALTQTPTITTQYYMRWANSCSVSECVSIIISVTAATAQPTGICADQTVCAGATATLTATYNTGGTGIVLKWYLGGCGEEHQGTYVNSGGSITWSTQTPGTYVFYAREESTTGTFGTCAPSSCRSTTVTVHGKDPNPTVSADVTLCYNHGTTLTAVQAANSHGILRWYKEDCNGTALISGTGTVSLTTGLLTKTTTYYAVSEYGCGNSACIPVVVTVRQIPTAPVITTVNPQRVCSGSDLKLEANNPSIGVGGVIKWYEGSCNGTYKGEGNSIIVTPTSDLRHEVKQIVYYAIYVNECGVEAACASITVNVDPKNEIGPITSSNPSPLCKGEVTTLSVVWESTSGLSLTWYSGSQKCEGPVIHSGNNCVVTPTETTRYYAKFSDTYGLCAESGCVSILIVVNDVPEPPAEITGAREICLGEQIILNTSIIQPNTNGVTLAWYGGIIGELGGCGVNKLPCTQNQLVVTPTVAGTYKYYARTEAIGCDPSKCVSITVVVYPKSQIPTNVQASPEYYCSGNILTLTADGDGLVWHDATGEVLGYGNLITVSPTSLVLANVKYYVHSKIGTCDESADASVTVTIHPLPVAPTSISSSMPFPLCNGQYTTLTPNGSGETATWYTGSAACGGILFTTVTGTGAISVAPTINQTYWVKWENNCGITSCASLLVTVNDKPATPLSISGPVTICKDNSTNLEATYTPGVGITLEWYDDHGTNVGTGSPITVTPDHTTTYYAQTEATNCDPSAPLAVTVTVNARPTTPLSITHPNPVCSGVPVVLEATYTPGTGISLNWSDVSCGGIDLGSGVVSVSVSYSTTSSVVEKTIFVQAVSLGCTSSSCLTTTVTVYPTPTALTGITAGNNPICYGHPTILTANYTVTPPTGSDYYWYDVDPATPGAIAFAHGTQTVTVNPPATQKYWVRLENPGCKGSAVSYTLNVTPIPDPVQYIQASNDPTNTSGIVYLCKNNTVTLTAIGGGGGPGAHIEWFSGSNGCVEPIFIEGTDHITVTPTEPSTKYYARWKNDCFASDCREITVYLVNSVATPTISITNGSNPMCYGSEISLKATISPSVPGTTIKWFKGECSGEVIHVGENFTTTLTKTTTFFASAVNDCGSVCKSITIDVSPLATPPTIITESQSVCENTEVTINAVPGNGLELNWYNNCNDPIGQKIGTGNQLVITPSVGQHTYFARMDSDPCAPSACASVTITVVNKPGTPTNVTATPAIVCGPNGTTVLHADGSGQVLNWYNTCEETEPVFTGNDITVTPTHTRVLYARWENATCKSACASVTIEVVESPIAPTKANVTDAEICEGTSVQLTAEGGSNGVAKWYAGGCGTGTPVGEGVGPTAALTVTPTVGTTVYYVRYENPPCNASACAAVTVTTYATLVAPTSITANPPVVGVGLPTTLTANGSGETLLWYNGACGGQSIGSGNPFVVTVTGNTTYYAKWTNPGCGESDCGSVTVTTQTLALSGVVKYNNQYNVALNGVHIALKQGETVIQNATTSTQIVGGIPTPGYYSFTNLLPGTYTLGVTYGGTWGGVNATDALVIEQHDAGPPILFNLFLTAGDVNADALVNSLDALWVKMRTVGMVNYFDAGNWVFGTTTSGSLPAINLLATQTFDFVGLCTGDVNASFIPSGTKEASFISFIDDGIRYVKPGETFTLDIVADKNAEVGAMTLFMNYDENLVEVEKVSSALGEVQSKIDGNNIGVAWSSVNPANVDATTPVLTLTMKAKGTIEEPKQVFTVNGGSEFANGNAIRLDNLNLKMAKLATATHSFSLNNYPNPFNNSTNIVYTLPEKAHVTLVITNLYGEVLRTVVNGDVSAGAHQVTVNASDLNLSTGVYLYKIEVNGETDNFSQVNKMIFTR